MEDVSPSLVLTVVCVGCQFRSPRTIARLLEVDNVEQKLSLRVGTYEGEPCVEFLLDDPEGGAVGYVPTQQVPDAINFIRNTSPSDRVWNVCGAKFTGDVLQWFEVEITAIHGRKRSTPA